MEKYRIVAVHPGQMGMRELLLVGKEGRVENAVRRQLVARGDAFKRGSTFRVYTSVVRAGAWGQPLAYVYKYDNKFYMDFPSIPLTDAALKDVFKQLPGLRQGSLDSVRMRADMVRALIARRIMPSWSAQANLRMLLDEFLTDRRCICR